jgi:hypothetical protein
MTFEEWWKTQWAGSSLKREFGVLLYGSALLAWQAADRAAREACAEQCEQRADGLREGSAIARQCAKDIRSRIG